DRTRLSDTRRKRRRATLGQIHSGDSVLGAPSSSSRRRRLSKNQEYSSFRGSGAAREPGTQEHRPPPTREWPVFIGFGPGPADHPGMTKKYAPTKGIS